MRAIPARLSIWQSGGSAQFAVEVKNAGAKPASVAVTAAADEPVRIEPSSRTLEVPPGQLRPAFFRATLASDLQAAATIAVSAAGYSPVKIGVGEQIDLSSLDWKIRQPVDSPDAASGLTPAGVDDAEWDAYHLGGTFMQTGLSVVRASIRLPMHWAQQPVHVRFSAIDDNDITYLNGIEIGRTNGWDKPRDYVVPAGVLKPGENNVLAVVVHNVSAGGGVYREPNSIGIVKGTHADAPAAAPSIAPTGKIGPALPLRRMHVSDGVLRYPDGREVALFGINYYPQSWYQFDNLSKLGVDKKLAVRRDLEHMRRMGVQVIRIHVFDREISDGEGKIVGNEHLDLLDYLVSEGSRRGLYFMFTPIAWWPGPNEQPEAFSGRTPKEAMPFSREAVRAQQNYLRQFMSRRNSYTNRRYADETAICALEIMNEPAYWGYFDMADDAPTTYANGDMVKRHKAELRALWQKWCRDNGCDPEYGFFQLFRYQMMVDYLSRMHSAIRSSGAKQPVASSTVSTYGQPDLLQAIADSPCEAITFGNYVGEWHVSGDGRNLLEGATNQTIDPLLARKARFVYEFDALNTSTSYMYPAFARGFRSNGAQIAAMFQYDSLFTARFNSDWDVHYLNLLYTPSKAASFAAASELFRRWPRGGSQELEPDDRMFDQGRYSAAVSYQHNVSLFAGPEIWINSNPVKWNPLKTPRLPSRAISVGNSPYGVYAGNGWWELEIEKNSALLTIFPDAETIANPYTGVSITRPVVELREREHSFRLSVPGVTLKSAMRGHQSLPLNGNEFGVTPGVYTLNW